MAVTENDLELLDAYLDDALESGDVDALRARLPTDAELLAAIEQLRAERSARRALFGALEPTDAEVDAFVARVQKDVGRTGRFAHLLRPMRYAAAVAACLAIGFFSRGLFDPPGTNDQTNTNPNPKVDVTKIEAYVVTLRDDAGRVVGRQQFDSKQKADEFVADLDRWQARTERLATGRVVIHADRF